MLFLLAVNNRTTLRVARDVVSLLMGHEGEELVDMTMDPSHWSTRCGAGDSLERLEPGP